MKRVATRNDSAIPKMLKNSPLFAQMTEEEIQSCLQCSNADCISYKKGEMIFSEEDEPQKLPILLDGAVRLGRDSIDGKRSILTTFSRSGDIFGVVILFLNKERYDCFAQASAPTRVVFLPREFMTYTCGNGCGHHQQLIRNLLLIFAQNAQSLNRRVQILTCSGLRQKIAKMLQLQEETAPGTPIEMRREELAELLGVARPSLSRELRHMQEDGLIEMRGRAIYAADREALALLL